jgi:hypothetical protein
MSSWLWWLAQAVSLAASFVVALILTRRFRRAYRRAQTDWVGLLGSMAIAQ